MIYEDRLKVGWNAKGIRVGSSEPQLRALGRGLAYAESATVQARKNKDGYVWFALTGADGERFVTWSDLDIVEGGAFMSHRNKAYGNGAPAEWAGCHRVWEVHKKVKRGQFVRSRALDRNAILRFDGIQKHNGLTPESPHWVCPAAHMPKYVIAALLLIERSFAITTTTRAKALEIIGTYYAIEAEKIGMAAEAA